MTTALAGNLIVKFTKMGSDIKSQYLSLLLTNGLDKMFEIKLTYSYVSLHREDVGIQGSWDAYFSLLQNAVQSIKLTESGDMELYYPLMQGARIKGTLVLGSEHEIKGMARHERIQEMLIEFVKKAQ